MQKHQIRTEKHALDYLTDCLLATVSDIAMRKSTSRSDYFRHIAIAQTAIDSIRVFKVEIDTSSRAFQVINLYESNVEKWAEHYKPIKNETK